MAREWDRQVEWIKKNQYTICQKNGFYPESNEELKHKSYFWYVILFIQPVPHHFKSSIPLTKLKQLVKLPLQKRPLQSENLKSTDSVGSKSDFGAFIAVSSLPLHAQYFSHSQIQVILTSMPFTPGCIVHTLLSTFNSTVYTHSLPNRFHPFLKWSSNVPSLQTHHHYHDQ